MAKSSEDAAKVSRKGGGGSREYMQGFQDGRSRSGCDSCGFDMRRPDDYGSEKDKSRSQNHCSTCYVNGKYVHKAKDLADFVSLAVQDLATQRGQSTGKLKLTLKKELKKLPRWK